MRSMVLPRRAAILLLAVAGFAAVGQAAAPVPDDAEIAALVEQLGADEYGTREAAAARLDAIGAAAIDSLIAAAESSPDLEVALRAHWLAESIPFTDPGDAAAVRELLDRYRNQPLGERTLLMHRLLRLDDDAGVQPLARLVRRERDPAAARMAAVILVREWIPRDPAWPGMGDRILAGLGASSRPTAKFVRTVVEFSRSTSAADRSRLAAAGRDLLPALARLGGSPPRAGASDNGATGGEAVADAVAMSQTSFERSVIEMLLEAGMREDAVEVVRRQIAGRRAALAGRDAAAAEDAAGMIADILAWSSTHGIADVVDAIDFSADESLRRKPILYAAAACERARDRDTEATRIAQAAFAAGGNDFAERVQAAILLVKWGISDWATREYETITGDPAMSAEQHAFAAVLLSEFLHDQGRDAEAEAALRPLVESAGDEAEKIAMLQRMGRDPLMVRARMNYFAACAAAARGDAAGQRKSLEEATSTIAKDVDALIALYHLADGSADGRSKAVRLIHEALALIEGGMDGSGDDTTSRNEYAWLVANTEGDIAKATRYSRQTLADSPDNPSYLDTLAHCHAAAGNVPLAIRTQRLAHRLEPHNRMIRLNLEKFERQAAAATGSK